MENYSQNKKILFIKTDPDSFMRYSETHTSLQLRNHESTVLVWCGKGEISGKKKEYAI